MILLASIMLVLVLLLWLISSNILFLSLMIPTLSYYVDTITKRNAKNPLERIRRGSETLVLSFSYFIGIGIARTLRGTRSIRGWRAVDDSYSTLKRDRD